MLFRRQLSASKKQDPELQLGILSIYHVLNTILNRPRVLYLQRHTDLIVALLFEALVVGCCLEVVYEIKITTVSLQKYQNHEQRESLQH